MQRSCRTARGPVGLPSWLVVYMSPQYLALAAINLCRLRDAHTILARSLSPATSRGRHQTSSRCATASRGVGARKTDAQLALQVADKFKACIQMQNAASSGSMRSRAAANQMDLLRPPRSKPACRPAACTQERQ